MISESASAPGGVPPLRLGAPALGGPRVTPGVRVVYVLGAMQAGAYGRAAIGTEHMLLGLIGCDRTTSGQVFASLGFSVEQVHAEVRRVCGRGWLTRRITVHVDGSVRALMGAVARQAPAMGDRLIRSDDLLLALAQDGTAGGRRVLDRLGVGAEEVRTALASTALAESGHPQIRHVEGRCWHG